MRTLELFNKGITIREFDCQLYDESIRKFDEYKVNLFVQVTDKCNAQCSFCEFHDNKEKGFNTSKLKEIIQEIQSKCTIGKLNFTGGEPTIDMKHFDKVFNECINTLKIEPEITVNTNGINLMSLLEYIEYIDSVGLSRHHYKDELNQEVFKTSKVASYKEISSFQEKVADKCILHGRCNLIKGYIDSTKEIKSYMDFMSRAGIIWYGFVTLMPLNEYCKKSVVLDSELIRECDDFRQNELWHRYEKGKLECQCADYLYCTEDGNIVSFYNRIFCNPDLKDGQLVYDGQYLREGFNGRIIY